MDSKHREIFGVAEQATQWLLTMESPKPAERAAFWKWMDASPLHIREFILAVKTQRRLRGFDRTRQIDVDALVERARLQITRIGELGEPAFTLPQQKSTTHLGYAVAATLAFLAIATFAYLAIWTSRDTYSTKLGQQLVFVLEDGSVVSLNTDSRMKVRFSKEARDLYLPKGQALFEVKHDSSRPFRVHAASSVVEAIGTQFDVRILGDHAMVSVLEGAVNVTEAVSTTDEPNSRPIALVPLRTRLAAGEGATINALGEIKSTSKIDVATVLAWKQQRLIFTEETLGWIVDEFNRYNATSRLKVEGAALRSRRFNGVFHAHSPESLIEYLQHDPSIAFDRRDNEIVIREATQPNQLTTEAIRP